MTLFRPASATMAGAILLLATCAAPGIDYPISCVTQDYVICEGPPAFSVQGVTTIRIGANNNNGSPSGRRVDFSLARAQPGELPASASLTVRVAGRSGSPAFNGDLWGIGFE